MQVVAQRCCYVEVFTLFAVGRPYLKNNDDQEAPPGLKTARWIAGGSSANPKATKAPSQSASRSTEVEFPHPNSMRIQARAIWDHASKRGCGEECAPPRTFPRRQNP